VVEGPRARRLDPPPVVDELARRGFAVHRRALRGADITPDGPKVLEFNARLATRDAGADARLEATLLQLLFACAVGDSPLLGAPGRRHCGDGRARGSRYPARSDFAGAEIEGIAAAEGPARSSSTAARRYDTGRGHERGRILSVTATAPTVTTRRRAYAAVDLIPSMGSIPADTPVSDTVVGILVGSESTASACRPRWTSSDARPIAWEFESAPPPDARRRRGVREERRTAGLKVLICGAGLAAALPGVVAAKPSFR